MYVSPPLPIPAVGEVTAEPTAEPAFDATPPALPAAASATDWDAAADRYRRMSSSLTLPSPSPLAATATAAAASSSSPVNASADASSDRYDLKTVGVDLVVVIEAVDAFTAAAAPPPPYRATNSAVESAVSSAICPVPGGGYTKPDGPPLIVPIVLSLGRFVRVFNSDSAVSTGRFDAAVAVGEVTTGSTPASICAAINAATSAALNSAVGASASGSGAAEAEDATDTTDATDRAGEATDFAGGLVDGCCFGGCFVDRLGLGDGLVAGRAMTGVSLSSSDEPTPPSAEAAAAAATVG